MSAANEGVAPGRDATARRARVDAGADCVEHVLGHFAAQDVATEGGDHVAFKTNPVVYVIGEVRMKAAEICRESSRVEMDEFVADGEIPAIAIVAAGILRGSRRLRECGLRQGSCQGCKRHGRRREFGYKRELDGVGG